MASSNYWLSQISKIEATISDVEELKLIGIDKVKNGNDELGIDDRMKQLWSQLRRYRFEYNNALIIEGSKQGGCFIPSREYGL